VFDYCRRNNSEKNTGPTALLIRESSFHEPEQKKDKPEKKNNFYSIFIPVVNLADG